MKGAVLMAVPERPAPEEISRSSGSTGTPASVFDAAAADFMTLAPRLWDPLGRMLVERSAPRPGERVLDACCGAGASALPAARAAGRAGRVDAVDVSGALVEGGRRAARDLPQLRFIQGDVTTWRPTDGPYDLVQSAYGVFFLSDMDAGSRHLVSLLRRGGRFAVQTWRRGALADFARCMFEAAVGEVAQPMERPASTMASERIDSVPKLAEWLSSLGLTEVRVWEVPCVQPLTPEMAWDLVRGTGWRHLLTACDEAAVQRIRDGLLARIERRGLTELDAGSLTGIGIRA
jgi:trans-aconitate methyltransferase